MPDIEHLPHKESKVIGFITYKNLRMMGKVGGNGEEISQGKGSLQSHINSEQETESRVAIIYYL